MAFCQNCGAVICSACGQCHDCAEDCIEELGDEEMEEESDLERDRR
jgi:hypothetical protein